MTERQRLIREMLESPTVVGFMRRHAEVESAPRWTCPHCQFESNEHYETHAPGCPEHVNPAPLPGAIHLPCTKCRGPRQHLGTGVCHDCMTPAERERFAQEAPR